VVIEILDAKLAAFAMDCALADWHVVAAFAIADFTFVI
jgi:hypothetical protein